MLTVRELSQILEPPLPDSSNELHATWQEHWSSLGKSQESADAILTSIDDVRDATRQLLRNLE